MKGDYSRFDFVQRHWREKHYSGVQTQQGRVTPLDSEWNEQLDIQRYIDETTRRDVIGPSGTPEQDNGFAISVTPGPAGTVRIGDGRYYVDGILCENDRLVPITEQPNWPGFQLPRAPGFYVAYLDVWQRHITALEDPEIREVALGGPDTATRMQTTWRVGLQQLTPANPGDPSPTCAQLGPSWRPEGVPATPSFLRARAVPSPDSDDPCILPAQAGYRRLENQLYRVEIHDGSDAAGGSTFKWSRDNGIVASRLIGIDGMTLTVADPGKDRSLSFAPGQWVELSDATRVLQERPGELVRLSRVEDNALTVEEWPSGAPPELDDQATVRRWDSRGATPVELATWTPLEDGVEVELRGPFRSGDYWTIPARTNIGGVLWPLVPDTAEPAAEERHGIRHHYCALAILRRQVARWEPVSDCRRLFPPLIELLTDADDAGHVRILDVLRIVDNAPVGNDERVTATVLAGGLRVECDADVVPALANHGNISLVVHLPFPLNPADREFWGNEIVGSQPLVLDANFQVNGSMIRWLPTDGTARWLRDRLFDQVGENAQLLARFTLSGNLVVRSTQRWFWVVSGHHTPPVGPPDVTTINVNAATEDELINLPGIGGVLARAIIANRPYESADDLTRVPGLRRSLVDALRARLTF
jgi:hypothetical protein